MLRFLLRQLRSRPSRAGALGVAVLVAAGSFVLLTSAARTTAVRVRGSVEVNYRTAYDILVRPRASFAELERSEGLVRNNYLSGIFGGITFEQYERIKKIPGVDIAAPIANVGYILPFKVVPIVIDDVLTNDQIQLYRLRKTAVANGLSRYAAGASYVYYTKRNPFAGIEEILPNGQTLDVRNPFNVQGPRVTSPFQPLVYLSTFSELSLGQGQFADPRHPLGKVSSLAQISFPLLIAAIDPVQEARLVKLNSAVSTGRYLTSEDTPRLRKRGTGYWREIPVIASTKTYVDEHLEVQVERLQIPRGAEIPQILASSRARTFVTGLPGERLEHRLVEASSVYEQLVKGGDIFSDIYWTPREVRYQSVGRLRVQPRVVTNPPAIWRAKRFVSAGGHYPAPQSNADLQFRALTPHTGSHGFSRNVYDTPHLRVVGRYDPAKLPGFSPLSGVPLETYYPPALEPADVASRKALRGKPLLPTQNVGDYIQQPPLLLTTLEGMKPFLNPKYFEGVNGRAPISVIRIRVAGVKGPDELSQERVKAVAVKIREQTGLDVDITVGSSPREVLVELPKGKFGRPALLLEEGWVKKGVSVSFLNALARKDLALFTLIPLVCGFFLANGAFASARARRREIGTLLCMGWSQRAIFAAVLGEIALIGLIAGVLGTALAGLAVFIFSLEVSLLRVFLVLPISLLLAVLAGFLPAWRAARSVPLDAVRPAVAGRERSGRVRRMAELAAVNLRRAPARTVVGSVGLLVGVAALTLMLAINRAFHGTLVGTLLGDAISLQIRGVDFLAVGLVIVLAALSLADVLFLNLRERSAELVTLRTFGWDERHVQKLVALEALGLGLLGSVGGALVGLIVGVTLLGVPFLPLLLAAFLATLGGLVVALVASLLPLSQIGRLTPPTVLAAE